MNDKLSKFKVVTTPFSIIKAPLELIEHSVASTLIPNVKGFGFLKKAALNFIDSKLKMSSPETGLKEVFEGYELNMFYHGLFSSTGKINYARIDLAKNKYKNILATHANYEDPIGSYDNHRLNLATNLTNEKKKLLLANIRASNELIAKGSFRPVVFHGGYGKKGEALDNVIKNAEFILNYCEKNNLDLDILLENLPKDNPYYVMTDAKDLKYINDRLKSSRFGFCFDLGHAGSAAIVEEGNNTNFRRQYEIIGALGNSIKYAHLNYNDSHLMSSEDIKKYKSVSEIDWHGPFPTKDTETMLRLKQLLEKLNSGTNIHQNQIVNLEIFPRYYFPDKKFGRIEAFPHGYETNQQVRDSVKFIRDAFHH